MASCKHLNDLGVLDTSHPLEVRVTGDADDFLAALILESTDPEFRRAMITHSDVVAADGVQIDLAAGHFYQAFFQFARTDDNPSDITITWSQRGQILLACTVSGKKEDRVIDRAFWFDGEEDDA